MKKQRHVSDPVFLVVWMTNKEVDHWVVIEDREEADARYNELCEQDDVSTASVCVCLKSTDYDTIKSYQT